jgi:hypothetical protein
MYKTLTIALVLLVALPAVAQNANHDTVDQLLSALPTNLSLGEQVPVSYRFICDYYNLDPSGSLENKERVSGGYTRGLPGGIVKWDDVSIAKAKTYDDPYPIGVSQTYMDGFEYKLSNLNDAFTSGFFPGFPDAMETKTLVWDTAMFETFAGSFLNRLTLNAPYYPVVPDTSFPGGGSFHNRKVELTWIGISKRNDHICALIQYEAYFNTISFVTEGVTLNGTSSYGGIIWLSLSDKEIEYATLREDVSGQVTVVEPTGPLKFPVHTVRLATFQRLGVQSK